MDDDSDVVKVWTDGSCCLKSSAEGGWAFYIEHGSKHASRYGFQLMTTVNVMELTAILRCLQFARPTPHPLVIYTDSQYARRCLTDWVHDWRTRNWKTAVGDPVRNKDLIEEIVNLLDHHKKTHSVDIKWVRGHSGHLNNERCDLLARQARIHHQTNWRETDCRVVPVAV